MRVLGGRYYSYDNIVERTNDFSLTHANKFKIMN